jgi:hypothetical protein
MVYAYDKYDGSEAKTEAVKVGITGPYLENWLKEDRVTLLALRNCKCYALLAKTDFDPMGSIYSSPISGWNYLKRNGKRNGPGWTIFGKY